MSELSLSTAFSIWRPAINFNQANKYELNASTLNVRAVALIALAAIAFSFTTGPLFGLVAFAAVMLTPSAEILTNFEKWRATRALDQLAIAEFKSEKEISSTTMQYAAKSARVIQALTATPDAFRKIDSKEGYNLAETTYNLLHFLGINLHKEQGEIDAFKALIQTGVPLKNLISNFSLSTFAKEHPDLLKEALKNDVIKPEQYSPEKQFILWHRVNKDSVAHLLIQKGFDPNIQWEGNTPLRMSIANNRNHQVCFLLKHGATFSYEDPIFTKKYLEFDLNEKPLFAEQENSNETQPLKDFLQDKPTIQRILNQPRSKVESPLAEKIETHLFALWKPPISAGGYYGEFGFRAFNRAYFVGTCLMAGAVPILIATTSLPAALAFSAVVITTSFLYHAWEKSRSVRALHHLAIKEFDTSFPSNGIYKFIATHPATLNEVLAKIPHGALKAADSGITLWDIVCRQEKQFDLNYYQKLDFNTEFSVFTKVADSIFGNESAYQLVPGEKSELFIKALKSNEPKFVSYLLEKGYIKSSDLPPKQQLQCWQNVGHSDMIPLLVKQGWDINLTHDRWTPLLTVLKANKEYLFIKTMVENGANPNVAFIDQENKVTRAIDCTSSNAIKSLIFYLLEKSQIDEPAGIS